jgi:hypothetical protein
MRSSGRSTAARTIAFGRPDRSFPEDDLVVYVAGEDLFIKQISTGQVLHDQTWGVEIEPVMANGVVFLAGTPPPGPEMVVSAWDSRTRATLWTARMPHSVYLPRLKNGVDVFDIAAGALLLDVREIYTKTRRQYAIDMKSGAVTLLTRPVDASRGVAPGRGFYVEPEDLNTNIALARNGALLQPITKLHIRGREIALPEPCRSLPVAVNGWIYCVGDHVEALRQ